MPRLYTESRMMDLSWTLRQKPNWYKKVKDSAILARWRNEALDQQKTIDWEKRLTPNMIHYALKELESYAKLRDNETGIEHACDDSVFRSSQLIPEDLAQALRTEVAKLEEVPDEEKDWHPNSSEQVLDLVHPSLYPIVYGRTLVQDHRNPGKAVAIPPPNEDPDSWFYSKKFCWLPSDFSIAKDGAATLASPYINNIQPSSTELMDTVTRIVGRFAPLWERVLGAMDRQDRPDREAEYESGPATFPQRIIGGGSICIWTGSQSDTIYNNDWRESEYLGWPGATKRARQMEWLRWKSGQGDEYLGGSRWKGSRIPSSVNETSTFQTLPNEFDFMLEQSWRVADLKEETLQVAMLNERIVSTSIYYYNCENITDSHLAFRICIKPLEYHEQEDHVCMKWLYYIGSNKDFIQSRGQVPTLEGICLAFPNIYQHCVSSFAPADPTKPGHRKILALFLADPNCPIPSATAVLPQQGEWIASSLQSSASERDSLMAKLSKEPKDLIVANTKGLMSRQGAEAFRLELMDVRKRFVRKYESNVVEFPFNMCER